MKGLITMVALLACLVLTGCASAIEACQKPKAYQSAQLGKKVETPEGLDPLPEASEMSIPSASPEAPPPPGECVDMPPTLRTNSGGDDNAG